MWQSPLCTDSDRIVLHSTMTRWTISGCERRNKTHHYSITSSAATSRVGEISTPSVLRLMTKLEFGRLLDRHIAGLLTTQNTINVPGRARKVLKIIQMRAAAARVTDVSSSLSDRARPGLVGHVNHSGPLNITCDARLTAESAAQAGDRWAWRVADR